MHIPFFRIFYSTTFTVLSLLLVTLLLITPADQIRQAFKHRKVYNVFIIAGAYLLTLLIAIFLYASRLFNNRSVLASIPRPWSPVENGDVKRRMRRFIAEGLKRSAIIAYQARPRDLSDEQSPEESAHGATDDPPVRNSAPVWGIISHPGWSSPSSPDLPNLHYEPVIHELAHLIEAKAVSLAPKESIPLMPIEPDSPPPRDPFAVELLQRPATMGLRDYIWHLTSLGMIHPSSLGDDFLNIYEKARFSNRPLDETEFRALMHIFAAILRGMTALHPDAIPNELRAGDSTSDRPSSYPSSLTNNTNNRSSLDSNATVEHHPQPQPQPHHIPSSFSFSQNPSPTRHHASSPSLSHTSPHTTTPHPNPNPPTNRQSSRRSSITSQIDNNLHHHPSSSTSLRPPQSHRSSISSSIRSHESSGSVIRLADAAGPLDLPYILFDDGGRPL